MRITAPNPGPQTKFLKSQVFDVCYGGARGGGKTMALLMDFVQYAELYGKDAKGILFRKSYPELQDIIAKADGYLRDQLGWRALKSHPITYTSQKGAVLELSHLDTMKHAAEHDGHEHPWQGFDEIGNWPDPAVIDRLLGCARSSAGIPTYRRSTCMPGGSGHSWVKTRYSPDDPYRIRDLVPMPDRPDLSFKSLFIPAKLEDNPKLNAAEYELALAGAAMNDRNLFEAWRKGRWDIVAGAFFENWSEDLVVPTGAIRLDPWTTKWLSMDWGYKDDTVVHWHAQDEHENIWTYRELRMNKSTPEDIAKAIVANSTLADGSKEQYVGFFLSPDAFAERTSKRTIAHEIGDVMLQAGLPQPSRADNDRVGGWQLMNQLMLAGKWKIARACKELVKAIPLLQRDEKKREDIAPHPNDHAPDSARYGLKTFLRDVKVGKDEKIRRYIAQRYPEAVPVAASAPVGFEDDSDEPMRIDGRTGRILNRPADHPLQPKEVTGIDYQRLYLLEGRAMRAQRGLRKHRGKRYGRRYAVR